VHSAKPRQAQHGPAPSSASATAAWPTGAAKKALVAVGNSMLTIIWHLLADPDTHYRDLGADFYETHINQRRRERSLISQLEQITGKKVTLQPAPQRPAA